MTADRGRYLSVCLSSTELTDSNLGTAIPMEGNWFLQASQSPFQPRKVSLIAFSLSLFRATQIKTYSWDNAQVILVGNKCDMEEERVVPTEKGRLLAEQLGVYTTCVCSCCMCVCVCVHGIVH